MLPRGEVFPCYSWFLFALVPGRESSYALRLLEVRGQKLAEPVLFQEAEGYVENPHDVTVRELAQQLGAATEHGRMDEQGRVRQILEKNRLPSPCRYELVSMTYDPLVRWRTGRYEIRSLAQFTSAGETP